MRHPLVNTVGRGLVPMSGPYQDVAYSAVVLLGDTHHGLVSAEPLALTSLNSKWSADHS